MDSLSPSDETLIASALRGDMISMDTLVRRHQSWIFNLALRMVWRRDAAEDATQEILIKAVTKLSTFAGSSAFRTWLYRIAVNTARNSIASRQRRPLDYEVELSESEQNNVAARLKHDDTPEATALSEEIRQTVNEAIGQLPEDLRTAIVLREFDGLSYEEIAFSLDIAVGTVKSRLTRARQALRTDLVEVRA